LAEYVLRRRALVRASLDDVFDFFSDARNLEEITPAWLRFRIVTPGPIEMKKGTRIRYRLRIAGIPVRWESYIARWDPGRSFVDRQERGPFRAWLHTHTFDPMGNGVLMSDVVRYALPFGPLGRLVHALWIRRALARIFDYRSERIGKIFGAR
jgi:ligand-binding SRPBCC domain-containing protein